MLRKKTFYLSQTFWNNKCRRMNESPCMWVYSIHYTVYTLITVYSYGRIYVRNCRRRDFCVNKNVRLLIFIISRQNNETRIYIYIYVYNV